MKQTLLMFTLFTGLSCVAHAGMCGIGTLADYTASGFTCTLDGITFSNFVYTPAQSGGAFAPDASGVAVTPQTGGSEIGFLFSAAWLVSSKQTEDSLITYTASCDTACISDVVLEMVGGATGTGSAGVTETTSNGQNLTTDPGNQTPPPATFTPVDTLDLRKDIAVSGGTDGTGHVSAVYNLFSTTSSVPEPSMFVYCLGALALLPVARRKWGSKV